MTYRSGTERPGSGGGERRRLALLLSHTLQALEKEIAGHSRRLDILGRFHAASGSAASRHAMLEAGASRDRAIADLWAVHDVARHSNEGRLVPPRGLSKQGQIAFARQAAHYLPRRGTGGGGLDGDGKVAAAPEDAAPGTFAQGPDGMAGIGEAASPEATNREGAVPASAGTGAQESTRDRYNRLLWGMSPEEAAAARERFYNIGMLTPEERAAVALKKYQEAPGETEKARARLQTAQEALGNFDRDYDGMLQAYDPRSDPEGWGNPILERGRLLSRVRNAESAFGEAQKSQQLAEDMIGGRAPLPTEARWRSYLESGLQATGENAIAAPVKFAGIIGGYLRRMPGPETDEFGNPFPQQQAFPRPEPHDNAVYRSGEQISEWMKQQFPADPARQYETGTELAHKAGALAALFGTKGLESLLAQGPRVVAAAGKVLTPTVATSSGGVPAYEDATKAMKAGNVSEGDRLKGFAAQSAVALTSWLPVEQIWGAPAARNAYELFGGAVKSGALQATQATGSSVASDLIAKEFYDRDRQIGAAAREDAMLAAMFGLFGHGGVQYVKALREGKTTESPGSAERLASREARTREALGEVQEKYGATPAYQARSPELDGRGIGQTSSGLGGIAKTVYSARPEVAEIWARAGIPAPDFYELNPGHHDVFHDAIKDAKDSIPGGLGAAVTLYPPEAYAGMRLFLTADRKIGFALKGDDVVSLFRHTGSPDRGFTAAALDLAVSQGGRRLDAFDTVLPKLYSYSGFRTVSRTPFDPANQPEGWDYENFKDFNKGKPDVVFMVYDPAHGLPYKPGDGKIYPSYELASEAQLREARRHEAAQGLPAKRSDEGP